MTQLILITVIFLASLSLLFYIMMKNGQGDFYSIIIFIFILATWIIPTIFYSNLIEIGLINRNNVAWVIIGVLYFLIQAGIRYLLALFSKFLKSKKLVFSYLLLMYAVILFITIFIRDVAILYILIIASSILGATYGLSAKYWMENTGNKKVFQANALIYSLPILSGILAYSFSKTFQSLNTIFSWSLTFSFLCMLSILMGVALYFLPEKRRIYKQDHSFDNEKIIKEFSFKTFSSYPILLGIGNFIYMAVFTYITSYLHIKFTSISLILLLVLINFISFLITFITSEWLIKNFGFLKLNIIGISFILIGILLSIFTIIEYSSLWQLLFLGFLSIIIGTVIINSSILGDIIHIEVKTNSWFLVNCLTVESFGQALGFLFGTGLIFLHLQKNIAPIILFSFTIIMVLIYSIVIIKNNLLLNILRTKFIQYEFLVSKNNKK